jgi:hypothetical protein
MQLFLLPCHVVAFLKYFTSALALSTELKACRIKFLCLETCGVRKRGKTKEKDGAGYEAITCFIA